MILNSPEGNVIEARRDTPFLRIGGHKNGEPILYRVIRPSTPLPNAIKATLVSMASMLRSKLSAGMLPDLTAMARDACTVSLSRRMEDEHERVQSMSRASSEALRDAVVRFEMEGETGMRAIAARLMPAPLPARGRA